MSAAEIVAQIPDPELPMLTLADLGIVRGVCEDSGRVRVIITPTYSGCPALDAIRDDVRRRLHDAGYPEVDVRTAYSPPWSTDWISAAGLRKLAEHGIAPPRRVGSRVDLPVPQTRSTEVLNSPECPRCGSAATAELSRFGSTPCQALYRCTACAEPFGHVKEL